jgi:hypothetical protein
LACGIELIDIHHSGGTDELLKNWSKGREFNGIERMCREYLEAFDV